MSVFTEHRGSWSGLGLAVMAVGVGLAMRAWDAGAGRDRLGASNDVAQPAFTLFVLAALIGLYFAAAPMLRLPPFRDPSSSGGGVRVVTASWGHPDYGFKDVTHTVRKEVKDGRLRIDASNEDLVGGRANDPLKGIPKFLVIQWALDGRGQGADVWAEDDTAILPLPKDHVRLDQMSTPAITDDDIATAASARPPRDAIQPPVGRPLRRSDLPPELQRPTKGTPPPFPPTDEYVRDAVDQLIAEWPATYDRLDVMAVESALLRVDREVDVRFEPLDYVDLFHAIREMAEEGDTRFEYRDGQLFLNKGDQSGN